MIILVEIVPILLLVLGFGLIIRGHYLGKKPRASSLDDGHRAWFAWYPVHLERGGSAFWRWVQRYRQRGDVDEYVYRELPR